MTVARWSSPNVVRRPERPEDAHLDVGHRDQAQVLEEIKAVEVLGGEYAEDLLGTLRSCVGPRPAQLPQVAVDDGLQHLRGVDLRAHRAVYRQPVQQGV